MALLPVEKIWYLAWFDPSIRAKVANELWASWPIPAHLAGKLGYWFFYHAAFGPPPAKEFKLWPPSWRVWIDAESRAISQLERISPKDVGLAVKEGQPFATHAWPKEWSVEEADQKRVQLLQDYDRVVRLWETSKKGAGSAEQRELKGFCAKFKEVTPPPLFPCYWTLGKEFFTWVGCDLTVRPAP